MAASALVGCGLKPGDRAEETSFLGTLGTACASHGLQITDLHADFRDIWKGREAPETGKQAQPDVQVGVDFSATVAPSSVVAQFLPATVGGSCGTPVNADLEDAIIPSEVWGVSTSNAPPSATPGPFNVFVAESISGVSSAGGAIAAGGDITLASFSANWTTKQPTGVVAGGKVALTSGSVSGDVSFGVASTIPGNVSVSGKKLLRPFAVSDAFRKLAAVSRLLSTRPGIAGVSQYGTLKLTGTNAGLNNFVVSAQDLSQASSVLLNVPKGAFAIVNVTGTSVTIQSQGMSLGATPASSVLWNLPSVTSIRIASASVSGSILAPLAALTFDSGQLAGTVVARSFVSKSSSLTNAPLNVAQVFGPGTPSSVTLMPAEPLVRGCMYQFTVPSTQAMTADGSCLGAALGVSFRVATFPSTPAARELAELTTEPTTKTLRTFEARAGINTPVDDVWTRYGDAIGAPAGELQATGAPVPSATRPGQSVTVYQQMHGGYPVLGFGYFVASEQGLFRNANGKVMPALPPVPSTTVSQSAALSAALAYLHVTKAPWTTDPVNNHAPTGRLVLQPKRSVPSAADFRLVWDLRFAGTGVSGPAGVQVDAVSGVVLGSETAARRVTPISGSYQAQVDGLVDTFYSGQQKFNVAQYKTPAGALVTTLATANPTAEGALVTAWQPDPTIPGQYIVDPTPATPWTTTEPNEQAMATMQWGLELAAGHLEDLGLTVAGAPWKAIDGKGHARVVAFWRDPAQKTDPMTFFDPNSTSADRTLIVATNGTSAPQISPDVLLHEFGHALVYNLRLGNQLEPILAERKESGAIDEGLADGFAMSFNHKNPWLGSTWACLLMGNTVGQPPTCDRRFDDPGAAMLPSYYMDILNYYFDFSATDPSKCTDQDFNDNCGVHNNSTIVSHWLYLLGAGSASVAAVPCDLKLEPLADDVDQALKMAITISYLAVGTRTGPSAAGLSAEPTFADFRDATIRVARDLVAAGTYPADTVTKIERAWYAVGVGPAYMTGPSDVDPADDSAGVYPWTQFDWPTDANGATDLGVAWDFQLSYGPLGPSGQSFTFNQANVTDAEIRDGGVLRVLPLALPPLSDSRFTWRVRKHSASTDWQDCYPVHQFVGTTALEPVKDITVDVVGDDGKIQPGEVDLEWSSAPGAVSYDVAVATTDVDCDPAAAGAITTTVNEADLTTSEGRTFPLGRSGGAVHGVLPNKHYWVNVRPIGPKGLDGKPATGACVKTEFDTGPLPAPDVLSPKDGAGAAYDPTTVNLQWSWLQDYGEPATFTIQFFEVDEAGHCAKTPSHEETVQGGTFLPSVSGIDVGMVDPLGYCWDILASSADGQKSPATPQQRIVFTASTPTKISPGVQIALTEGLQSEDGQIIQPKIPAPLVHDSYGKPVTFKWKNDPNVLGYTLKVGRYDWSTPLASIDPANCVPANSFSCKDGPVTVTYEDLVSGGSAKLTGDQAGKGRNCWTLWPVLADPKNASEPWSRQPLVDVYPMYCYTSGPSKPEIVVDSPPPASGFSSEPITGKVIFHYVPDGQVELTADSGDVQFGAACPRTGPYYNDIYDCERTFTIQPKKSTTYTITARTWNSDQSPPVKDDTTLVHEVSEPIVTGSCGGVDEECCDNGQCNKALNCRDTRCVPCGAPGEACCDDGSCADDAHACGATGTCDPCGGPTEVCCAGGACQTPSAFQCGGDNKCNHCGYPGQACCNDHFSTDLDGCVFFDHALDSDSCQNGQCLTCGKHGGVCCPQTKRKECDDSGDKCLSGKCNKPPVDADCTTPLIAPKLPQPPLNIEGIAGCAQYDDDISARMQCIVNDGPASDLCQYFHPQNALALGWPAVPGAAKYEITQLAGNYLATTVTMPAPSGGQNVVAGLQPFTALAGTIETCQFAGYGVLVRAINACGVKGPAALTGIGYIPSNP